MTVDCSVERPGGNGDWDDVFDGLLRRHLRFLGAGEDIDPHDDLRALGLDSMGTVELMLALEERYGVNFPDEALTASAWATPTSLWRTLSALPRDTAP